MKGGRWALVGQTASLVYLVKDLRFLQRMQVGADDCCVVCVSLAVLHCQQQALDDRWQIWCQRLVLLPYMPVASIARTLSQHIRLLKPSEVAIRE